MCSHSREVNDHHKNEGEILGHFSDAEGSFAHIFRDIISGLSSRRCAVASISVPGKVSIVWGIIIINFNFIYEPHRTNIRPIPALTFDLTCTTNIFVPESCPDGERKSSARRVCECNYNSNNNNHHRMVADSVSAAQTHSNVIWKR